MQKLHLDFGKRSYDIIISSSFAALPDAFSAVCGKKALLVTDSNVAPLYLDEVRRLLCDAGVTVTTVTVPAGEQSKNIAILQTIYDACIAGHLDRKSTVVALGGGVVGDMAGFAAATYMRGIQFVQIPTTLLAQTDSSVGGKVGIDYSGVKNIVGAFLQPSLVYINTATLNTLPKREFSAGMAEVVKYGIIKDKAFLRDLEAHMEQLNALDTDYLQQVIYRCCAIKAEVVQQDETESGIRAILNFGHTIGHGIESAKQFALLHGECVAIGMAGALEIAVKRGYISQLEAQNCVDILHGYGLAVKTDGLDVATVLDYMKNDKKKENGHLRFVLPRCIGAVEVFDDVSEEELTAAVSAVLQ